MTNQQCKKWMGWLVPAALLLVAELVKYFPGFIEIYYANGIYPPIGKAMRAVFGWLPVSVGDLLTAMLVACLLYKLAKSMAARKRTGFSWKGMGMSLAKLARLLVWIYLTFLLLWGFNYYRQGTAKLLAITPDEYTTADVDTLLHTLNSRLQTLCVDSAGLMATRTANRQQLSQQAMAMYNQAGIQYEFLHFTNASLKPNLIGPMQSYTGYSGYLFPFTGEAHVNFRLPTYVLPYTVCHEMAHQLGFGSESEANMIAYLACRRSANASFAYSMYTDMNDYALHEMWNRDSVTAKFYAKQLPALAKNDRKEMIVFIKAHQNPAQPVINWVYNHYLLRTNQPQGLQSYNRVVAWLIAYGKKYGWQAI